MTTGRRGCAPTGLLLLGVVLFCLATALLLGALVLLPAAAAELGPAASGLGAPQRTLLQAYLILQAAALDRPAGTDPTAHVIDVAEGEMAASVIDRLAQAGVVRNPGLLRAFLRYRGLDVGVQAGRYTLNGAMTIRELADALQHARPDEMRLTIPEGWRLEQIAQALPYDALAMDPEAFLKAAHRIPEGYSFSDQIPSESSLEGFLFPDTYSLKTEMSAEDLLTSLLDNFERRVDEAMRAGFFRQGLSLYQAVTLASIVEREAIVAQERPLIASVFLNRLRQDMRLEADPTVQYLLGRQPDGGWWKAPLSAEDLALDSPYNTYLVTGLPPGPIANPGLDSLRAVADPQDTDFFYFRAACDGSGEHLFARTFDEHLQNACP